MTPNSLCPQTPQPKAPPPRSTVPRLKAERVQLALIEMSGWRFAPGKRALVRRFELGSHPSARAFTTWAAVTTQEARAAATLECLGATVEVSILARGRRITVRDLALARRLSLLPALSLSRSRARTARGKSPAPPAPSQAA